MTGSGHLLLTPLVIIGAGGHGRELLDVVEALNTCRPMFEMLGFLDDVADQRAPLARRAAKIIGPVSALATFDAAYVIGLGDGRSRRRVDALGRQSGRSAATLVHPAASLGSDVSLGAGSVICAGARVTTNVRLGRHVHVNINATVSHDCTLGDFATVSPGVTISGNATIEDEVLLGAGATVMPSVRVGASSVVGAGAVVISDLAPGTTAVGVPARPVR